MESQGGGYYVWWGIGIVLLLAVLAYGVIRYRTSRAGREQGERERRQSRQLGEG
jgi:membrane protein implicated in regulation of membrane protease activity